MTDDRDPNRQGSDAPGAMPRSPAAVGRVRSGRTRGWRLPRAASMAALALAALVGFTCLDAPEPRSAPRGELDLPGHARIVQAVAFSPDGRTLASGGLDRTVRLWDATRWGDGAVAGLDVLDHPSAVYAVAFSPDGSLLAAAGDGFATIWSCRPPWGKRSEWLGGLIRAAAFSPDGRTLALAGVDGAIPLLEVPPGRPRVTLRGPDRGVLSLAFSPDGALLASSDTGGRVVLWDVARGVEARVLMEGGPHPIPSLAFAPDGRSVAVIGAGRRIQEVILFDPEGGAVRARVAGYPIGNILAFAPDGRALATAGAGRLVRFLDPGTAKPVAALDVHISWLRSIAFSPDGRWLACAADGEAVRVVDLAARRAEWSPGPPTPADAPTKQEQWKRLRLRFPSHRDGRILDELARTRNPNRGRPGREWPSHLSCVGH